MNRISKKKRNSFHYYFFDIILFVFSSFFGVYFGSLYNKIELHGLNKHLIYRAVIVFIGALLVVFACLNANGSIKAVPIHKVINNSDFVEHFWKTFKKNIIALLLGIFIILFPILFPSIKLIGKDSKRKADITFTNNTIVIRKVDTTYILKIPEKNYSNFDYSLYFYPHINDKKTDGKYMKLDSSFIISDDTITWYFNAKRNINVKVDFIIFGNNFDEMQISHYANYLIDTKSPDKPVRLQYSNKTINWDKSTSLDILKYSVLLKNNINKFQRDFGANDTIWEIDKSILPGKYQIELTAIDSCNNKSTLIDTILID